MTTGVCCVEDNGHSWLRLSAHFVDERFITSSPVKEGTYYSELQNHI